MTGSTSTTHFDVIEVGGFDDVIILGGLDVLLLVGGVPGVSYPWRYIDDGFYNIQEKVLFKNKRIL